MTRTVTLGALAVLLTLLAACGGRTTVAFEDSPAEPTSTTVERPSDPIDELVAVEGGRLHIRCVGEGPTTVVLIGGWGDDGTSWGAIEPTLARSARVCSSDRFGNGSSDAPASTQTFATQAEDLADLLAEVGEVGPYVLVGHSFGGAEAVTFASQHRAEVSGLVLLDPTAIGWIPAVCAVPADGSEAARVFAGTCSMAAPEANQERLDVVSSFAAVAEIDALGSVPLAVLVASERPTAGLDPAEAARLDEVRVDGMHHWAALSTAGRVLDVRDSGHHIQLDRPDVVIAEIEAQL